MTTECTEWSMPDGDHFHGVCVNEFEPEIGSEGCPICVSPAEAALDVACWNCDAGGVPRVFNLNGNAPGYLSFTNPITDTHSRSITSKVDNQTVVARSDWTTGVNLAPTGSGAFTLLPDPSPHCSGNAYPPYVNDLSDRRCSYRVGGRMTVDVKIVRPGVYLNNGAFTTFTRPNNGVVDRYFPINQFVPGTQLNFGTFEISLEENPHHFRSIIGNNTLVGVDGTLTCKFNPTDGTPTLSPILYGYGDEIEAMRQTLVNPSDGIPVTVQVSAVGFAWILSIETTMVSGVKTVVGQLRLYRKHHVYYQFAHNGYATAITPGTGDCATLAFSTSGSQITFTPFFGPLQADDTVCILAPIGAISLPNNPALPLGWHPNAYAGNLPLVAFPGLPNFDQAIGPNGHVASGSFSVPCTSRSATVNMTAGNGLTSTMNVSW